MRLLLNFFFIPAGLTVCIFCTFILPANPFKFTNFSGVIYLFIFKTFVYANRKSN